MVPPLLLLVVTAQVPHRAALDLAREEGALGCPSTEVVQGAVTQRLGYSPWVEDPEIILNAVLSGGPGGYTLHLAMLDASGDVVGQRDLASVSGDCHEISEAMILDLAMAIDPQAALRPVEAPPVTTRKRPPRPRWRPSPPSPERPGIAWRTSAWTDSVLSLGTSPGVAGGLRAGGALHWGVLAAGMELSWTGPSRVPVHGGFVGTQLTTASWLPCVEQGWFQACTAFTVGALVGRSQGLEQDRRVTRPYAAVGARLMLEVPVLTWLSLRGGLDASVPFNRVRLVDATNGEVFWTMPAGNASVFTGLGVRWP